MKVKINGFRIQSTLRDFELKKQAAKAAFEDSLHFFENESKTHPAKVMEAYADAEHKIAALQELQARYNLTVSVLVRQDSPTKAEPNFVKMSLQEAVKLVGGASREEKLWREAAEFKDKKQRYYDKDRTVREKDSIYARAAMTPSELTTQIRNAARFTSALREAIQVGNATTVELDVLSGLIT